jgi:beta-aspartyl-peptidase (threonine type)
MIDKKGVFVVGMPPSLNLSSLQLLLLALIFSVALGTSANLVAADKHAVAIVIHGGAGTIRKELMSPDLEAEYRAVLTKAIVTGHKVLTSGGSSRDAIIAAITLMEDSPLFNAGHGAVFNHEGNIELDASIMEGRTLNAGAVAALTRIKSPIRLANAVLDNSPHVMLVGVGAEVFAQQQGFDLVSNDYFKTDRRRLQLERIIAQEQAVAMLPAISDLLLIKYQFDEKKLGTVGAVAIDQRGDIAAGTSTGGMTNKRFGRVGDAPIIGAGTYADNESCGISATGHGEYFIRAVVAHDICARMAYKGISLQQAQDEVVQDKLVEMDASGGVVGIDKDANVAFSFNSLGMYRASIDKRGDLVVKIFKQN